MEGFTYKNKQDISTRNDHIDAKDTEKDLIEYTGERKFSKTIKEKSGKYKTPNRNDSINQTPKLVGLSKLVSC